MGISDPEVTTPAGTPAETPLAKPGPGRAGLKHIGGYFNKETTEQVAILRARLNLNNEPSLAQAIDRGYCIAARSLPGSLAIVRVCCIRAHLCTSAQTAEWPWNWIPLPGRMRPPGPVTLSPQHPQKSLMHLPLRSSVWGTWENKSHGASKRNRLGVPSVKESTARRAGAGGSAVLLVVLAALSDGAKPWFGPSADRESTQSWSEVLRDEADRGISAVHGAVLGW